MHRMTQCITTLHVFFTRAVCCSHWLSPFSPGASAMGEAKQEDEGFLVVILMGFTVNHVRGQPDCRDKKMISSSLNYHLWGLASWLPWSPTGQTHLAWRKSVQTHNIALFRLPMLTQLKNRVACWVNNCRCWWPNLGLSSQMVRSSRWGHKMFIIFSGTSTHVYFQISF